MDLILLAKQYQLYLFTVQLKVKKRKKNSERTDQEVK